MELLDKNASLEQIIDKINEIISKNDTKVIEFNEKTLNADVKSYFDTNGGMLL